MASGPATSPGCFRFGDEFELDVRAYELRSRGTPLKLKPISMELLIFLVEHHGELLTRDQIVERIWGKGVFLDTDNSINSAISKLRTVLRDDPERPRFVLTVPGKGYRFIAPIIDVTEAVATPAKPSGESLLGRKVSHYRILEILGGGGMGIVYEAEDLKLGRRVAIKFLPSELAHDPKAFERFEREARAASALDHHNICSIYQLGEHEGQPFIVMQLLEGQTLREWIGTEPCHGRPRFQELLLLAVQILDGLDVAHQKGILHRDIKPANIFVTSTGEVKILDFGVAKFLSQLDPTESVSNEAGAFRHLNLTATGSSMGTPSYLSPEQIRGERLDARSDLFSFGLVLYEMVTGQRAFAGNTAPVIRDAVLNQPIVPVRQLNPEVPSELERIITRSLEKDRERRYASAQDLRTDLIHLQHGVGKQSRRLFGFGSAAAGLLLLIGLGVAASRFWPKTTTPAMAPTIQARRSVAVLGFRNLSGETDADWISTALSEMLSTELASGDQLRVISGENVAHMKLDLSLPTTDSYGSETLARIRKRLNTDDVVLGSYLISGNSTHRSLRIDLQLQDATKGETITAVSESGSASEIPDLVSRVGAGLRDKMGIGSASELEVRQTQRSLPANPEAMRLYAQGLVKLRSFDDLGARNLLERAVSTEPYHALSHSALAETLFNLGYDSKAGDEAKKAFDLSADLPRADHLFIEGRYHELTRDYPAAIEIYRTLHNFFPDDLEYALHLAQAQMKAGRGADAEQTIARMRNLPEPQQQDPRIDIMEARLGEVLGDFRRTQRMAAAAEQKAQLANSGLLMANAKEREGWALDQLGEFDQSLAALIQARDLFAASGNPLRSAIVLLDIGDVQFDQGHFAEAHEAYNQALKLFRQTGAQQKIALTQSSLGSLFYEQGMLAEAKKCQEDALRIDREIGNGLARDLNNLGNVLEAMGDLQNAYVMRRQAVEGFHNEGDTANEAISTTNLAAILFKRGDIPAARKELDQAMAMQQKIGHKHGLGFSLFVLAEIQREQDQLDQARASIEQNVALRKGLRDETDLQETQLQLAELALDQKRWPEAESLARAAAASFHQQNVSDLEAQSYAYLSRALLDEGKLPEARSAAEQALLLSRKGGDVSARFEAQIADAAVQARSGNFKEAFKLLEATQAEVNHDNYFPYQLEVRLQMAQLRMKSGQQTLALSQLKQLHTDAQARGFDLVARKASLETSQ